MSRSGLLKKAMKGAMHLGMMERMFSKEFAQEDFTGRQQPVSEEKKFELYKLFHAVRAVSVQALKVQLTDPQAEEEKRTILGLGRGGAAPASGA